MLKRMDLLLAGVTVVLTLFGLAMIASVSVFKSYQITTTLVNSGVREFASNSFYLWRSFFHVVIGFSAMGFCMLMPYRLWQKLAMPLFGLTLVLLVMVFFLQDKEAEYAAYSWLRVGPFSLQPSELLKLTLIFYLALWLQKREQLISTWKEGFLPFALLLLVSTFLVAIQPDLGSFLVLSSIAVTMFFIAGGNIFHVILGALISGVLGLPLILQQDYIRNRFRTFFTILFNPNDPTVREGIGYQVLQALIAIGSGGAFGVGYGKSIQKFGYLPEVQADMVFSAMAEELGFFRLLIILGMYAIFAWRGYRIARNAPDRFGFLVATGITTWITFQALLNIGVNIALFPLTGLTLPFISYGGSSLLSVLIGAGILLNISMHSTEEAALARRTRRKTTVWQRFMT